MTTPDEYKAITKQEADGPHPASHYLVVEDPEKPTTWHLRVKDSSGDPDHRLMGAAWAALHEGYRGNRYEGPNKQEAINKLRRLYAEENMDTPGGKSIFAKVLDESSGTYLVGGYGVAFGGRDLEGETFDRPPGTDYLLDLVPSKLVTYDHRQHPIIKSFIGRTVNETVDDYGIFVESELKKSQAYIEQVIDLIKRGVIGYSSGSVPHLVERAMSRIKQWPIVEYALTTTPAEPRLLGVEQLKALVLQDPSLETFMTEDPEGSSSDVMAGRSRLLQIKAKILLLENLR